MRVDPTSAMQLLHSPPASTSSLPKRLADTFGRVDAERATTITEQIDDVRQAVSGLGERQASTLTELLKRIDQNGEGGHVGELTEQLTSLVGDVKSNVRAVVGLGSDISGLRTDFQSFAESMPDRTNADAEVRAALAHLDEAVGGRDLQLRDTVERLDAAVAARDAELREAVSRLDEAVASRSSEADFSDLARQFDAAIAELRRDLQGVTQAAVGTDAFNAGLRDVRTDLQLARAEVESMTGAIGDLRSDVRRSDVDANATLAASAASSMARLEGRMDGEFDTVSRQMEALGTLLGQVIDSVHRVESQVIGVQPVSEKMRTAAAGVLETLRANVRQRTATRRNAGGPPEFGG
jgi:chromosome segregation ATPase